MPNVFARTFVYEDSATRAIKGAPEKWRAESIVNMLEWVLMRDPTVGELLNETGLRGLFYSGARSTNEPDVEVLYEDKNQEIVIHGLVFKEAKAGHAGRA